MVDRDLSRHPRRSYVICTTPRSGSTLLCKMLAETGVAGMPDSHFHVPSFERWLKVYKLCSTTFASRQEALTAIFEAAIERGMANTPIFGLRLQRGSFDFFMDQLSLLRPDRANDVERVESVFGPTKFIHLSRADRISQAISLLRAEQTGLWHRHADGSELERLTPSEEPHYDANAIARHVANLTSLDTAWNRWFEKKKLEPLKVTYDALSDAPQTVLEQVLSAIGSDPSVAKTIAPLTAKLANKQSEEWRQRFENENIRQ